MVAVLGAVAWHNGRHRGPIQVRERFATVVTLLGAGAAIAWLVRSTSMGVGMGAGVRWTLVAASAAGLVVVAALVSPRVASVVADQRMRDMASGTFALHVAVRIPLLTALAEEAVHRGVVWALLERAGGDGVALVGTTIGFAVGHVVVARDQAVREGRAVVPWVGTTLAATAAAGVVLGWLRWRTGGIWASVGVHAAVNMVLALGGRWARVR